MGGTSVTTAVATWPPEIAGVSFPSLVEKSGLAMATRSGRSQEVETSNGRMKNDSGYSTYDIPLVDLDKRWCPEVRFEMAAVYCDIIF